MARPMLLSNSTSWGRGYLDHATAALLGFVGPARRLAFVPFALADQPAYATQATSRFGREGVEVRAVPEGAWLSVEGASGRLEGAGARLFQRGREPQELAAGTALDALLRTGS